MSKRQPNGRYKKVLLHFPDSVPKRLISLYKKIVKKYKKEGGYQRKLARHLNVNDLYVHDLLVYGKEPTDKTIKGIEARVKLFLPAKKKKIRIQSDKPKVIKPDYIIQWDHLPKEERHQAIKDYLKWRNK